MAAADHAVWVILRHRLGWTLQRPERRASERDEEAIARWVAQDWPRIKKGPPRFGLAGLLRRISRLADPTGPPDLVTTRPQPGPAASVRLEAGLDGHRPGLPGSLVAHSPATGRVYLWAAWTTSLSSLGVAAFFDISLAAKTAFAGVSLLGFATTTVAFFRIRQGKILQHREWMIRSYSLAFSL
jgi:hypothetical protein